MKTPVESNPWEDAVLSATLFALDPAVFGGVLLRGENGPAFASWLALLQQLLPPNTKLNRIQPHIGADRLLGGLDVAASLRDGRPIMENGVLATAHGGVLVLTSAERMSAEKCAHIAAALDNREIVVARDGLFAVCPAAFGLVAIDEGRDETEKISTVLADRLAFHVQLPMTGEADLGEMSLSHAEFAKARQLFSRVRIGAKMHEALCNAARAFGVRSLRSAVFAVKVARAHAALLGRRTVTKDDASVAARLVLAPRALLMPPNQDQTQEHKPEEEQEQQDSQKDDETDQTNADKALDDVILEAVKAALPKGLLDQLAGAGGKLASARSGSGADVKQRKVMRGRPIGVQRGNPRNGARLHLVETLRAAAPWQKLRRATTPKRSGVLVRSEDFRVRRFKQRSETTAIFAVDASGSAALHRLGEAKGAVELILADCYIRRDKIALIAFRGRSAELLLPPTRSLQRAKRNLVALPGGGGTPLSAAIDSSRAVAALVRQGGGRPLIVFLTDARANIARDGSGNRAVARADALTSARAIRMENFKTLLIDVSQYPQEEARLLAGEMGAAYLPLPHADAGMISRAVSGAMK
jgi:magnesium chelatase subunit D